MSEIYISTDIETDGPIPGPNSMLSLGSAAFRADGTMIDTFSVNLLPLEGAAPDPATMEWWKSQPEAWEACRQNPLDPREAMLRYCAWLSGLAGKPVFVAYPAGFDFLFVYWYLMRLVGSSPFSFSAIDIKTFAFALLPLDYRAVGKKTLPTRWKPEQHRHTHVALDDAIEQGEIFCAMLREARSKVLP